LARFRPGLARLDCDVDFVDLRVEPFADFVAVLRCGADLDVLTVALPGARVFAGDVFAFARRLVDSISALSSSPSTREGFGFLERHGFRLCGGVIRRCVGKL
jgi:hypothetical protein